MKNWEPFVLGPALAMDKVPEEKKKKDYSVQKKKNCDIYIFTILFFIFNFPETASWCSLQSML